MAWLTLLLIAGCHISRAGEATATDAAGTDAHRRDAAGVDAAGTDAPTLDGRSSDVPGVDARPQIDAGPLEPTRVLDLAVSTHNDSHPAVIWTGTEFAVAYFVGDGSGTRSAFVEVAFFAAGSETAERRMMLTPSAIPRDSVSLAADGPRIAVSWLEEETAGRWQLDGVVIGGAAAVVPMHPSVRDRNDFDDAQVYFDGGDPIAVARIEVAATVDQLNEVEGMDLTAFFSAANAGELSAGPNAGAPLLVASAAASVFERQMGRWILVASVTVLPGPDEGDVTRLPDGSLSVVFAHSPPGESHVIRHARLRPLAGGAYDQVAPASEPGVANGPDPAIDAAGDRTILAWCAGTAPDRPLGIAALDRDGALVALPCQVPPLTGRVSNDPDIACGGGWCLVIWLEADDYDATDFETRMVQVPVDPVLVCP